MSRIVPSLRDAFQVNGVWRRARISGRSAFVHGERVKEPRVQVEKEFKVKKTMVKAKEAHNPETIHKKLSKFPEQILTEKRDYLTQRLEDKQGVQWFQRNWQEKLARRRRAEMRQVLSLSRPVDLKRAEEIRRIRVMQLLTLKPGQFIGS